MGKINIVNDSDGHLTVELDGKAITPQEIFNSSDSSAEMPDDTGLWNLQTLGEQYDLTFKDIMAAIENYADTKNADIDYSVDELASSVEPEAGAMSTFYENNKGSTPMNITKGELKQLIKEETSWYNVALDIAGLFPGVGEVADIANALDYARKGDYLFAALSAISMIPVLGDAVGKGGKVAITLGKMGKAGKAAAKGAQSAKFLKISKKIKMIKKVIKANEGKVVEVFDTIEKKIDPENEELLGHIKKMRGALVAFLGEKDDMEQQQGQEDDVEQQQGQAQQQARQQTQQPAMAAEGTTSMNITKGRLKQIIQEELSRVSVEEGHGIEGHEPEEKLVTVTEEELIEARHAAYYLIKNSLESGADPVSLEGTVRDVYGYNVPSYILELFSDKEEVPVEEAFGMHKFEPEEELVTVAAIDIVDAVSELIKRSLDSGADAGSLMGEVKKVFGENIPNQVNDLFPIDMGE